MYIPQVGEEDDHTDTNKVIDESSRQESSQQMVFHDSTLGETIDYGTSVNPVALVDGTPDVSLGDFLSRPTLINRSTWNAAASQGQLYTFDPWNLFCANAAIKKKLDNYAFIRGQLKVKFLVNATPFWYGMAMASYIPLSNLIGDPNQGSTTGSGCLIASSQQPHVKIIPHKSAGGEMCLPFFYHKNWLPLTATDLTNMGTIKVFNVAPLASANAATAGNVVISAYAWMENVELMGPTVQLAAQVKDEYGDGPISAPASALANFASKVRIPGISKFAKATEIGARAVSNIASLFGYSNVPVIDNVHGYMPAVLPHMASAGIGTMVQKLTLDPKSELSIDPSLHGVPSHDPLEIQEIVKKESLVATQVWTTSMISGDPVYIARVQPVLSGIESLTWGNRVLTTPMGYLSQFFQYWRGSIIFRFKIVASQYHQGRIRITYDPVGRIDQTSSTENVCYTKVIDIGEDQDVEIVVPYHQATAWQEVSQITAANWAGVGPLAPSLQTDNGLITFRVESPLIAPVSTASVYVLMYVRAGEDFEYAVPSSDSDSGGNLISLYAPQVKEEASPVDIAPLSEVMGKYEKPSDDRFLMNIGESIKSLRSVLQRASTSKIFVGMDNPVQPSVGINAFKMGRMPLINGYDPNALDAAFKQDGTSPTLANFVAKHPLPYVTAMFRGYRGSINHSFSINGESNDTTKQLDDFRVVRLGTTRTLADCAGINVNSGVNARNQIVRFMNTFYSWEGTAAQALTASRTNAGLAVSMPDYNNNNFNLFAPNIVTLGSTADNSYHNTYAIQWRFASGDGGRQRMKYLFIRQSVGAGVDFTPVFFLCAPSLYVYSSVPTAPNT